MKRTHKLLSILLTLALLLGMVPMTAMAAGEKTEVTQIETRISAEYVPYAGRDYTDLYTYIDSSIYGRAQNTGSDWVDDAGVTIEEKGNGDYGEWYNIRYQFEAGRTYTAEYSYMINPSYEETYKFTENTTVTLTNPDPSKCTITGEVIEVRDSGRICDVRYTMTIAGERSYPDIKAVTLQKIATPADGVQAETTALMYSNCTLTSQAWSPNVSTFAAGNTYTLTVNLRAKDGYKFSNDFAPVLGVEGYEKAADHVELLNNNEDAAVSFTYAVGDYTYVDTLQFVTNWPLSYFIPTRETSGQPMTFPFDPADGVPFENRNLALGFSDNTYWYNETDGYEMNYKKTFEAGKVYSLSTVFDIKKDLLGEYRFADNATAVITGPGFSPSGYQAECSSSGTSIIVKFLFTGQFPGDEGSTAYDPAVCNSYAEFKYAMESSDIRYVALGDVEDMLPAIPHDEEKEPDGITRTAIVVRGHKDLNLLGNAVFRCPLTGNYDLKYYIQLITLTDAANSSLYIHGPGSLTYAGGTLYFVNSAITVDGGHLTVDGATVRGSNGYHTGYCYGINARRGSVTIQNGATIIGEVYGGDGGICAMAVGEEGETRSLSVSIFDGKFYVERDTGDGSVDHGITVWNDCGLRIYGMTSDGIKLGRDAADTLDEYVANGCSMTVNGVKTDPATCGTINGYVEVYTEISEVDLALNSPAAGESPVIYPEEVYWVPTGAAVESITWYENGQPWDLRSGGEQFEAGNTYKVEIVLTADDGVKFANPLTSATVNYKTAEVSAHAGSLETGIVLTADLGECADAISDVALTVTAPKEGQNPSYTVGCGSDAYYAVGGSNNYTEYRKWYMSSDNDEWWEINGNHNFMSGYYYKFVVEIRTNNGYEFPLIDNGTIQPNVSATVNGYYATVTKAYEQDPSRHITVEYNFGECNDSVVEKIIVENVTAPVAGEKPNYTYSISGSGYQMDTSRNAYEDIYWKNPPEKWYYVKNGISWWDTTTGSWEYVYENSTFVPGHTYACQLYLIAENDFEFAGNGTNVTATINGEDAEINTDWTNRTEARVFYTFTCAAKEISTVMLYNLDAPKAGETPDTEVTSAYPELYVVDSVRWLDEEDGAVNSFEQGRLYTVEITVEAKDYDGVDGCIFANEVTAYIDGTEVTGWTNSVTTNNDNTVTIRYGFRNGASAPEGPSGTTVSGSAVSWNDTDDAVYLLYSNSTADSTIKAEWAAGSYNALYTATKGNITDATVDGKAMKSQTFTFEEVADGTYKLVILKPGKYVPKIVEVTVGGSPVSAGQQKLWLYGDVNYDGSVNNLDILQINRNISSLDSIFDAGTDEDKESRNVAANVTALISGDTEVNNLDVLQINRYISSLDSIFDTMK